MIFLNSNSSEVNGQSKDEILYSQIKLPHIRFCEKKLSDGNKYQFLTPVFILSLNRQICLIFLNA